MPSVSAWLKTLRAAPPQIWSFLLLVFCSGVSYGSMTVIFVVFLSEEFGFADEDAGMLYGLWGTVAAAWGVLMAPAVDSTGVKSGLLVGFVTTAVSRLILVMTADHLWVYIGVLVVSPIGMGLADPVFLRSLRLYTNDSNRSMIFGFYYSCSNLGIAVGAWMRDLVVLTSSPLGVVFLGTRLSQNRMVLLIGAGFACFGCGMSAFLRTAPSNPPPSGSQDSVNGVPEDEALLASKPSEAPSLSAFRELFRSKLFWRYVLLQVFLVNLKATWRHMDATLPKYLEREFGSKVPYGSIYNINTLGCFFLPPLVSFFLKDKDDFDVLHLGSFVTGISPFVFCFSNSVLGACLWVALLTVGEVLWSPRALSYGASIAPPHMVASFMSIANIPQYASKLPTGLLSGYLISQFLPDCPRCKVGVPPVFVTGDACARLMVEFGNATCPTRCSECPGWAALAQPQRMWAIIGAITFSSPVLLTIFRKWLRENREADLNNVRMPVKWVNKYIH